MASNPDRERRAVRLAVVGFVGLVVLAAGLALWAPDVDPVVGWAWFTAGALLAGFAGYIGARRSLAGPGRATRCFRGGSPCWPLSQARASAPCSGRQSHTGL